MTTGAWPIDPSTPVGLFRTELGDVVGVPADPATEPQTAAFEYISDGQIQALIDAYPDSRNTAMGNAKSMMATQMIAAAQDIQVDDIRIKTIERARLMLEQANFLLGYAVAADADTAFGVVPMRIKSIPSVPRGTPSPWSGVM